MWPTIKLEEQQTLAGTTYYSDPDSTFGKWRKPTGIYLPPGTETNNGFVDILLYLHGHLVSSAQQLFEADGVAVRKQVLASGRNIVLVAPWLGRGPGQAYIHGVASLTGNWGELYIDDVLNALVPPKLAKRDLYTAAAFVPAVRLRHLILACHSGGGHAMRNLVGALGRYQLNLRACWGFDCLYGIEIRPDDANFWYEWSRTRYCRPLYISYGSSTLYESVKLYLMKEGIVNGAGARWITDGPTVDSIEVEIGIETGKYVDDVMELDKALLSTTPKPGQPQSQTSEFLDRVAGNVRRNAGWPKTNDASWEMHYRIARDGLLKQLKAVTYL
jgi:hypothetical protein